MRHGRRTSAVVGLGVLGAVGLAACGSGGSSAAAGGQAAPGQAGTVRAGTVRAGTVRAGTVRAGTVRAGTVRAVQDAYTASTNQKTAAFRLEETIAAKSSTGSTQNAAVTGSGQVNFAAGSFKISLNLPTGGSMTMLRTGGPNTFRCPRHS